MGGSSTPSNTTSSTTTSQVPSWLQPDVQRFVSRATKLSNRPYEQYTGEQIAPLNQQQQQGINMVTQRATDGSPLITAANSQAQGTLGGDYLGHTATANPYAGLENPYLQQNIDLSSQDLIRNFQTGVMPQTDAAFARSGAFGGSAWGDASAGNANALARGLGQISNDARMNNYNQQLGLASQQQALDENAYQQERARQMGVIPQAQELAQQPYQDAQMLLSAGDITRDYQQTLDNLGYQNFLNQQNWPLQNLDIVGNAIRATMGAGGSSVTQQQLPTVNPTAAMLGGGLGGAALGGYLGGQYGYGNLGALGGGALGALGGLLG